MVVGQEEEEKVGEEVVGLVHLDEVEGKGEGEWGVEGQVEEGRAEG